MSVPKQLESNIGAEITVRIHQLKGDKSVNSFAQKCGVPQSTMRKYLDGSIPSADKLVQIAHANGVTIQWLASGEIEEPGATHGVGSFNEQLMISIIETVENVIKTESLSMPVSKKAKLIILLYQWYTTQDENEVDMTNVIKFVDLAK